MIHPTALIESSAKIGHNVHIGPYSYIGADVEIGDDTIIESHVVIKGPCKIGQHNHIFQFASIGEGCQDKKYRGEPTELVIGDHNVFRECVTIHRGTVQDQGITRIGSGNLFMAYVHVAHDCVVGDNNILANNASIAGHVHVGDWCILAGFTGVHQFCQIGSHSFCGASSLVTKDVPPYVMADGLGAVPRGLNIEGLKRRGFDKTVINEIRRAYKVLYRNNNTTAEALQLLTDIASQIPEIKLLTDFVASSTRGIIR